MFDSLLAKSRNYIPKPIFKIGNPIYHWSLAFMGACIYRFPSRKIKVIAVTGTKGKSSTVEIINAIFEQAGYKTALTNTIRFKIDKESKPNLYKMSMPGRFFMQSFLRKAVNSQCDYVILEMTSQGSITFRNKFISLDTFVFTNISPEHIEAHGSYENYFEAKLDLARGLIKSAKKNRTMVVNGDDKGSIKFLTLKADRKIKFHINELEPYEIKSEGLNFTLVNPKDNKKQKVSSKLSGLFNLYNILAAITTARSQGINDESIISAIEKFGDIAGRVQSIDTGQDFKVIVDYAHTVDSLEKVYKIFRPNPELEHDKKIIGILGGTGGGRDTWKRSEMGRIADTYCDEIILTNEDPYDENPNDIVNDVAKGIKNKQPSIIMDRRLAIREGIKMTKNGDVIVITGKGTDPYIMGPNNTKMPWSDAEVVREELLKTHPH